MSMTTYCKNCYDTALLGVFLYFALTVDVTESISINMENILYDE